MVLLIEGWIIETKGVAYGHVEARYGEHYGGVGTNLLSRKRVGEVFVFGRAG